MYVFFKHECFIAETSIDDAVEQGKPASCYRFVMLLSRRCKDNTSLIINW